ncbi:hypothetical protein [Clostridium cibarium]|uniref:Squalene cyclase C-terminal domain-containing protein n=1 Tax=Clostridium cibarium TaxID=2762247 RepID=A0ABR8PTF6_9CLOT|nr:hypothetical protein [Clostridium cibarium]MBD7911395.1 hypothetical protein [Clostridium cibarium]
MNKGINYIFGTKAETKIDEVYEKLESIRKSIQDITNEEVHFAGKSSYYLFPFIFNRSFDFYDEKKLSELCVCSVLCLDYCLYTDKVFDEQIELTEQLFHNKTLVNQIFTKKFSELCKGDNRIWDYYFKYYKEYVTAVKLEHENMFGKLENYSWEQFETISKGKQALAKIIPTVMGCLTENKEGIQDFEKALDSMSVALQLYDDLRDWKDDFKNGRYSWILNKVIRENNLQDIKDEKVILKAIVNKKYDTYVLDVANNYCENAILCIKTNDVWVRYIRLLQVKINKLMIDLMQIKGEKVTEYNYFFRNKLDIENRKNLSSIKKNTIDFIIGEYNNKLLELKHWMLNLNKNKDKESKILGADIFQRALLLNLLLDIKKNGLDYKLKDLDKIIENEVKYIIKSKTSRYDCGWVYNEGLYGNCPDLDTFSEILRVNCSVSHNSDLNCEVQKVLDKVFKINRGDDYFKTWIIYEDELDYKRIEHMLNMDNEIEVNANFAGALYNFDYVKYRIVIEKCLKKVYSKQLENGSWQSNWYVGNYYCGYVLSKTFKLVKDDEVINKYHNFLIESQNENGSWGDGVGNPLETSYSILSLLNIGYLNELVKSSLERATNYLIETVNENGYWYGCEFIKMGLGKNDSSEQLLRYRSSILTTIFCIDSLLKSSKLIIGYGEKNEN